MLKNLAVLAVVLIMQASAPVPRQSAKSPTQGSDDSGQQSHGHHQPSTSPTAVNGNKQSYPDNGHGDAINTDDKQQKIAVVSLPNVSITKEKKSRLDYIFDWGPWIFSLLLVVVGGLQVWLLFRTWKMIGRQADIAAAGMRQWVDVEVSGVDAPEPSDALGDLRKSLDITLSFKAINNTPYALTTKRMKIQIFRGKDRWEHWVLAEERILPPSSSDKERSHHISIPIQLNAAEVEKFANANLFILVKGSVFFEPAIRGRIEEQWFDLVARFGPDLAQTVKGWWANEAIPENSRNDNEPENPN